jgi:hypothetical protein
MKLALPLIAILLTFSWYVVPVNESVIYKRQAKLFYDRIQKEEPVRVQRCKTPGTVWWDGQCFRPERIPRS